MGREEGRKKSQLPLAFTVNMTETPLRRPPYGRNPVKPVQCTQDDIQDIQEGLGPAVSVRQAWLVRVVCHRGVAETGWCIAAASQLSVSFRAAALFLFLSPFPASGTCMSQKNTARVRGASVHTAFRSWNVCFQNAQMMISVLCSYTHSIGIVSP